MGAGDTGRFSTGEVISGALLCARSAPEGSVVDDVAVVSCGGGRGVVGSGAIGTDMVGFGAVKSLCGSGVVGRDGCGRESSCAVGGDVSATLRSRGVSWTSGDGVGGCVVGTGTGTSSVGVGGVGVVV